MQVKTNVKAGGINYQHNEAQVRAAALKVQTGVKGGATPGQDPGSGVKGLRVQTGVKAGKVTFQDFHFTR
jgi:hypothetical protein